MTKTLLLVLALLAGRLCGQPLPVRWDELVATDWAKAIELSKGTCLLPIGILEKHGPHLPIGSDLIGAQARAREVAKREYVVVFPEYYFGQIYEAKYAEGTVALPPDLISKVLQATLDEIARNGFKKIVIYSSHGGNPHWLRFFVQSQLDKRRDYVVYYFDPPPDPEYTKEFQKYRKTPLAGDEHAGEQETSRILAIRPDLVKLDRATQEDGSDQKRLESMPNLWTAVSWYARFPHHYAGVGAAASVEEGKFSNEHITQLLVQAVRNVKNDQITPAIQKENYDRQLK
ncbi:MAG TPA: creatininase family protein [Bryobacteraceae bacterium]|nr:creatininase family protein [Bryobacteraceae bacterium]